jgi:hypothetical protein
VRQAKQHSRLEENVRPLVKMDKCGDGRRYIREGSLEWGHPTKGLTCRILIWRAEWVVGWVGLTC